MDRRCHSKLASRLPTDSRVWRAPASTQYSTEKWLRRQVQSRPLQWIHNFPWRLIFLFAINSNLVLSSNSNTTIMRRKLYTYWMNLPCRVSSESKQSKDGREKKGFIATVATSEGFTPHTTQQRRMPNCDSRPFAPESRDMFYWHPDCLTSVFLARCCLRNVAFIQWDGGGDEAKRGTVCTSPFGLQFPQRCFFSNCPSVFS